MRGGPIGADIARLTPRAPHLDRRPDGPRGAPAGRRSHRRLSFGAREVGDHAVCSTDPDRTSYPETHALQDIHFEITQGEYVAISGPSGCGETTLLSILGLLDTPSDGNYLLDGHQVAKLVPVERARFRSRIAI